MNSWEQNMNKLYSWFSLFASTGTLICCALPSLLVALGLGAVMAGLVSTFPQLIWFSQYKVWVFSISGLMILASAFMQHRASTLPCPVDKKMAAACTTSRIWSKRILWPSGILWAIGAFFAFVAPLIFN